MQHSTWTYWEVSLDLDRPIGRLYRLLGYVKAHVYTAEHALIDALENNIQTIMCGIPAEMLKKE